MNLRCIYCQTPFTLARGEMLAAIVHMHDRNMNHYDAHCPRCRRANSISRQRMELFFPNWEEAAKQQASAPTPPPVPAISAAAPAPASAMLKTEPLPKAMKSAIAASSKGRKAGGAKPAAGKKPAAPKAKKPAAAKKATPKSKPAAKKAPAKGKKK